MTLLEVAKHALEAMEDAMYRADTHEFYDAKESLRYAIEQAEQQEPVAWMVYTEGGTSAYVTDNPNDLVGAYRALPIYTAPTPRKPLTDEEIVQVLGSVRESITGNVFLAFARAIEEAVWKKNS